MNSTMKNTAKNPIGALEAILLRDQFYYSNYRYSMRFFLSLLLLIGLLSVFAVIEYQNKPYPIYIATYPDGTLIDLIPLSKPNVTDEQLLSWATTAATAAFDYNFVNYQAQLASLRQYFTARGHYKFLSALKTSNNLNAVKSNKMVVTGRPLGPATIEKKGQLSSGIYFWEVYIPMQIYYFDKKNPTLVQNVQIKMTILRTSMLEGGAGLGIAQMPIYDAHNTGGST